MMEVDIDQSHLPRVQEAHTEPPAVPVSVKHTATESGAKELCQCFAVLEDGAFAHNLQEQEIEQYYNSNVQKNQLFQNDIRIAKRLQDEEEERMSQATLQLEEQDSEYARRIQEEIQRCAEETRRREEEDEEMAKRLQEEEIDSGHHGDTSDFPLNEGMAPRRDGACLELGELEQVLRDEELARMLQGEEVEERRLLGKGPQKSNPRGDFRAAQVAQDEEIARFMQRQERKAQRRSCDLGQGSRQEHREPGDAHERRSTRERKVEVPQMPRERLDSEGLNSPSEDLSPDCQPPSPNSTISSPQAMRNIAEELDPTFQAKRRDSNPAGLAASGLSTSPSSHSGLHDYTQEPTFVPPTKRQSDKSGRPKAKEKKESCKQQ